MSSNSLTMKAVIKKVFDVKPNAFGGNEGGILIQFPETTVVVDGEKVMNSGTSIVNLNLGKVNKLPAFVASGNTILLSGHIDGYQRKEPKPDEGNFAYPIRINSYSQCDKVGATLSFAYAMGSGRVEGVMPDYHGGFLIRVSEKKQATTKNPNPGNRYVMLYLSQSFGNVAAGDTVSYVGVPVVDFIPNCTSLKFGATDRQPMIYVKGMVG